MENKTRTFMICSNCEFFCDKKEPDKFCSLCGSTLIDNCPSCGKEIINPYAKFCKYCGKNYPGKTAEKKSVRF